MVYKRLRGNYNKYRINIRTSKAHLMFVGGSKEVKMGNVRKRRGRAVAVKGYSYTRKGKRITVRGYRRKKPKR